MFDAPYSQEELALLRRFSVPTLANAIETFEVQPANTGFCSGRMRCLFPDLPLMAGYAVTCRVSTDQPLSAARPGVAEPDYWRWLQAQPGPKVVVCQDTDSPVPKGAMWGEWNCNVHRALGCVGLVCEGAVRDLDAVHNLGFHYFATEISVSHGYGAFIDYGGQVRAAGLEVSTGDLLVGDQHGVLRVPPEISLHDLVKVAEEIDRLESEIFAFCQSPDFNLEGLIELDRSVMSRWPRSGRGDAEI